MSRRIQRNLPEIINEGNIYDNYNRICQIFDLTNPEEILAGNSPQEYLTLLRKKLESDHSLKMVELYKQYEEAKQKNLHQSVDMFVAGLSSEDRLKIKKIEALPYVERQTLFGFLKKEGGVTLNITKDKK